MIIVLVGPSGVGKGYLTERIVQTFPHAVELVWLTTRPLRPGEQGLRRNRQTVSETEFHEHVRRGRAFLKQTVHNHHYALDRESIPLHGHDVKLSITELHADMLSRVDELPRPRCLIGLVPAHRGILREHLYARPGTETVEQIEERLLAAERVTTTITQQTSRFDLVVPVHEVRDPTLAPRVLDHLHPILSQHRET